MTWHKLTSIYRVMMKWQNGVRTATLVKSPFRPVGTVSYRISEMGIRGLIVVRITVKLISYLIFLFNSIIFFLDFLDNTHTLSLSIYLTLPLSLSISLTLNTYISVLVSFSPSLSLSTALAFRRIKRLLIVGKGLQILWLPARTWVLTLILLLQLQLPIRMGLSEIVWQTIDDCTSYKYDGTISVCM